MLLIVQDRLSVVATVWEIAFDADLLQNYRKLINRYIHSTALFLHTSIILLTYRQTGISVDEAYRFLQNRWLEKQMLAKRKQAYDSQVGEAGNDSQASSGNGLLMKRRLNNVKGTRKNKSTKN